ncbi:MAG: glycosyltransferase [Bryobacteraceae bacterium]|nr:glycosyltransferase [Bryobacteraceae bacterium]MDW8379667.1 glycosyltransferase [Bryobacterales bacterium]
MLSILMPVYNEEEFVGVILERVMRAPLPAGMEREVIVVDDGSSDASAEIVESLTARYPEIRLIRQPKNQGKGAAIRTALQHARGEFSIIQDADLEYDPSDYSRILAPLMEGRADAVYGSRFLVAGERRVLYFWHALANWILTTICNVVSDLNLTDMETCYKAFRTSLVKSIPLRSNRFGIEPELTIKLAKREARIYEVPVSYHGRTYAEGKKIGWRDAVSALAVILRYALTNDIYTEVGPKTLEAFSPAVAFNRWMADTIRPYLGQSVLEIGAGIGNLSRHLIGGRKRYIASDVDEQHLARLRSRFQERPCLEVRKLDVASAADFADLQRSVDTVVCLNVLEHVEDRERALKNLFTALKPGGRAVLLVPHGQFAYGKMDEMLGHRLRYSRGQLQESILQAGFELERILPFNRIALPGWYFNGKILRRPQLSPFQLKVFDRLVWLWRKIDPILPWPPTSLIAIARRPMCETVVRAKTARLAG